MSTRTRRIVAASQKIIETIDSALWPEFRPTVANVRYVARHIFGLSIVEQDLRHERGDRWVAECQMKRDDDFTLRGTIVHRPGLTDETIVRVTFHELSEFLAVKTGQHLYDAIGETEFDPAFTGGGSPTEIRHQIALIVEKHYAAKWKLGDLDPESAKRIKVDVALITAEQWHRSHSPLPDVETVDPDIVI